MQHEVGSIVEGKVTGITKFGAFIELEDKSVGMVHISEISQSYVNDISEYLTNGQTVKVKILNVGDDGKISLSIKRALPEFQNRTAAHEGGKPPYHGGGNRPPRPVNRSYNNGRNNNNSNNHGSNRHYTPTDPSVAGPSKDTSFEDMLSKFIKSSDEKIAGLKQPERRHGYQKKNSRDYE